MKVGDKVVNSKKIYSPSGEISPVLGEIYTIRGFDYWRGETGLLLEEIVNPPRQYVAGFKEQAWVQSYFRPVDYSVGELVCEYITKECEKSKTPETV